MATKAAVPTASASVINPTAQQVSPVLQSILKQAYGQGNLEKIDTSSLNSVFDYVNSEAINKTTFLGALFSTISNRIYTTRAKEHKALPIWRDETQFGALLLKVYVAPIAPEDNEAFVAENGLEVSAFKVAFADIKSAYIEKSQTWQLPLTVTDEQLATAFSSESQMQAFYEEQYVTLDNSMKESLFVMEKTLLNTFMGIKINAGEGINAINLLAEYKAINPASTLTASNCLTDATFLKFAGRQIDKHMSRMGDLQNLYNTEGFVRHTPKDSLAVVFLEDYASSNKTYLESDTYHNSLVSLPGYHELNFWQDCGTSGSFAEVSAINIQLKDGTTVSQSGIIACVFDEYAVGACVKSRNSKSDYSPRYELTHRWERAWIQHYVDPSEQGLVFYVGE